MKIRYFLALLLFLPVSALAQDKSDYERWASTPKPQVSFPLGHKILLPRATNDAWDADYARFSRYITPALKSTQMGMSYVLDGIKTWMISNSISPHAQLDTSTIIRDEKQLYGTWRMLAFRSVRFNDSASRITGQIFRMPEISVNDRSADEAFATIDANSFKLYARPVGKKKFRRFTSSNYALEGKRFLMFYKMFKSGSGVAQAGIDENGYLILNFPAVIENQTAAYISYYAVIQQYIFQRVE